MAMTRAIELRTEIPGPRSKEILERKESVVAEPLSVFLPVVIAEGRGATITDVDGNTFIDFTGGVGCLNVGHSHPRVVAPQEFVEGVRALCDEHGIVLVVDEVQTGFGRTGKLWAIEHYGVEPDLLTLAKSIAAGLPLSAVVGKAEIMDAPSDSPIGGTYVGNPVAQAAALAVLDVFEEESLVSRAAAIGETIRARMLSWQARWKAIGDVRGLGAMLAMELVVDRDTKEPAPELASTVVEAAAAHGLLLLKCGIYSNCIRLLTPLVLSDAELDEALDVWEQALGASLA